MARAGPYPVHLRRHFCVGGISLHGAWLTAYEVVLLLSKDSAGSSEPTTYARIAWLAVLHRWLPLSITSSHWRMVGQTKMPIPGTYATTTIAIAPLSSLGTGSSKPREQTDGRFRSTTHSVRR